MSKTIDADQVYLSSQLTPIDLIRLTTYSDRDALTVDRRFYFARQPVRFDFNEDGEEDFWPVLSRIGPLSIEVNHLAYPDDSGVLTKPLDFDLSNEEIPAEGGERLINVLRGYTLENATVEWTQILPAARPAEGRVDLSAMTGDEHTFWYRGRVRRVGPVDEDIIGFKCETNLPTLKWTREMDQLQNDPKDYGKRVPAPFGEAVTTRCTGTIVGWVTTLAMPLDSTSTGADPWVTDATGFPDSPTTFTLKIGFEEVTAVRSGATEINISARGINSTLAVNHQAGEIAIEMLSRVDFTVAREDEWGGNLGHGGGNGYIINPQNGELVGLTGGFQWGDRSDVVSGQVRSTVRFFDMDALRTQLEDLFGKAFGGSTTILLPFHTKKHVTGASAAWGDALHNYENVGTNPKGWGDAADSAYEVVQGWWPVDSITNSGRVIRKWRGRHLSNAKNTHTGTGGDMYIRMRLYDFTANNLGGIAIPVYEDVDVEIQENQELFGILAIGDTAPDPDGWWFPTTEGVTLAALEGGGPDSGNARYCVLYGQIETSSSSPHFNADEYIEWSFYGLEIELDSATPELAGSFMGFGLDIWSIGDGRHSPTTTPDYKCGDDELMVHPVDIIRFWVEEVGGETLDYDSYDEAYLNLGPDAAWSFDMKTICGSWEEGLARMAYEARAVIVPEETAAGTVWKILTAPAAYAWIGLTAGSITDWDQFTEVDQDVGARATHASRFTFVYAPKWWKSGKEDAYSNAIEVNKDQNDIDNLIPTADLTAIEAKIGAIESEQWAFKCIQDPATAEDAAGWYVHERIRLPARLFAIKGVPWWQGYNIEVGDRLQVTPPWESAAVNARVISYTKDPEIEQIDLRLVELAPLPPQTVSMDSDEADSMWSYYGTDQYFLTTGDFTIRFRHKENDASMPWPGDRLSHTYHCRIWKWDGSNPYSVQIYYQPQDFTQILYVRLYGNSSSANKLWGWFADAGNAYLFRDEDVWYDTFVTWDNATQTIKLWTGQTGAVIDCGAPDNKPVDNTINTAYLATQMKRLRLYEDCHAIGHDMCAWDKVLSDAEIAYLENNKQHDPRENKGDYVSKDNLDLYFRHGDPASDWGKNHGDSTIKTDLSFAGGMDSGDIISDAP